MDTRRAFLSTARTLLQALHELAHYRIVGNTVSIAVVSVHVQDRETYTKQITPAIDAIRKVGPQEFHSFMRLFEESSIIIAYSWLDSFLSELEEALYLHDPASLGESVQIKLGKLLSSASIDEIVHDIAKRRIREKAQWGLKGRIAELTDRHKIKLSVTDADLEWVSDLRNNLVHNRRIGVYKTRKGKITYEATERRQIKDQDQVQRFLSLVFTIFAELYVDGSTAIGLTARFPQHRRNIQFIEAMARAWPRAGS